MKNGLDNFKFPTNDNIWKGNKHQGIPPYILNEEILMAIQVALVTNRPLLISGPPGSGKTSLAKSIAQAQQWSFMRHTLTSRSRLEDLTCDTDQLQRLHDAQAAAVTKKSLFPDWAYLKPGLFWWGFDANSAEQKGQSADEVNALAEEYLKPSKPSGLIKSDGIVILLDEIDKADPDLPNDLLEPLDQRSFQLPNGQTISAPDNLKVLMIITTNGERGLPPAFLRRCIHLELNSPTADALVSIAKQHFNDDYPNNSTLYQLIAEKFEKLAEESCEQASRPPGTSEFLDAVKACLELKITPEDTMWKHIECAAMRKQNDNG